MTPPRIQRARRIIASLGNEPARSRFPFSKISTLPRTDFDRQSLGIPFRHSSSVHRESLRWNSGLLQQLRGKVTVLALTAGAINNNSIRVQARGQDDREMILRIITVQLVGSGDVTGVIVPAVTCIDENDELLL